MNDSTEAIGNQLTIEKARVDGMSLGAENCYISASDLACRRSVMYATPLDEETSYESDAVPSPDLSAAAKEPGVDPAWKQATDLEIPAITR